MKEHKIPKKIISVSLSSILALGAINVLAHAEEEEEEPVIEVITKTTTASTTPDATIDLLAQEGEVAPVIVVRSKTTTASTTHDNMIMYVDNQPVKFNVKCIDCDTVPTPLQIKVYIGPFDYDYDLPSTSKLPVKLGEEINDPTKLIDKIELQGSEYKLYSNGSSKDFTAEWEDSTKQLLIVTVYVQKNPDYKPEVEPNTPKVESETPKVESETPKVESETPKVENKTPEVEPNTPKVEPNTPKVTQEDKKYDYILQYKKNGAVDTSKFTFLNVDFAQPLYLLNNSKSVSQGLFILNYALANDPTQKIAIKAPQKAVIKVVGLDDTELKNNNLQLTLEDVYCPHGYTYQKGQQTNLGNIVLNQQNLKVELVVEKENNTPKTNDKSTQTEDTNPSSTQQEVDDMSKFLEEHLPFLINKFDGKYNKIDDLLEKYNKLPNDAQIKLQRDFPLISSLSKIRELQTIHKGAYEIVRKNYFVFTQSDIKNITFKLPYLVLDKYYEKFQ